MTISSTLEKSGTGGQSTLRIAHFTIGRCNPDSANGVDKTVYYLCRAEAALGHTVAVFSLTGKAPLPIPKVSVSTYAPALPSISLLGNRLSDLLVNRSPYNVPRRLLDEVIAWRPDIVHLHFVHVPQNVRVARRAARAGIPYCVTINGGLSPVAQRRNRWQKRIYALLVERRYLAGAAFLHAISAEDVDGLREYGVTNQIAIAPNGIDLDTVPADPTPRLSADLAARVAGKRIFLFLGRLDPLQKGLDVLLRGFARSEAEGAVLVLVGPDWRENRGRLEALARELGISSRIVFAGAAFGEQKVGLLAACDVFVHPSRWEAGVPFSVLEAAALAKPLLLTRHADPSEAFGRDNAAVVATPDEAGICEGITRFLTFTPAQLLAMGANARRVVEREFTWEPIARTLVDAYRAHSDVIRG